MLTGNKGEWSEIYALLKILADQNLFAGDSDLKKIEGLIFPIIKILRDESNGTYEYAYESDLIIIKGADEEFRIPIVQFQEKAVFLLSKLKETTTASFSIPEIETFINSFNCDSLKAKSSVKSDIRIVIHDQRTGTTPELGFSIKSQLGGASTLLNAGKTTNFIYKIENVVLTNQQIQAINEINTRSKIKDRIEKIKELSGTLDFVRTESSVFGNNLTLIDSALPKILSELTCLFFTSSYTKTVDLVNKISEINPLDFNFETDHPYYNYKIKRFLTDVALGMMPAKVWTGKLDATGGYLVVKEDGEVLCYHIYNRNEFEDYLLNNTKLETASSTKHDFGTAYSVDNEQFFKLNLQIRFLK
ncbi:HpaII family restriction endonuclease [Flagellimonas aequoris]|uniref:HpaII family restriction endonuclease n=1 Tax=Flagellimonas aequoris TaxID=2306997 RepID=A0A418NA71_9FLAO|nr:HpaII family restriction endonuclease [Allomuricauda aequoris]RIV72641.1 HpaII family restriction endonuclease [Allomuricauda aequoris]TXK05142.1 HpaII family restriction endonuclease [Allomuricauda aequoris]